MEIDPPHHLNGVAFSNSADNLIYVTSLTGACVDVISLSGEHIRRISCDGVPTNCAFDESGSHIVTDAGVFPDGPYPQVLGNLLLLDVSAVNSTIVPDESEDDTDG